MISSTGFGHPDKVKYEQPGKEDGDGGLGKATRCLIDRYILQTYMDTHFPLSYLLKSLGEQFRRGLGPLPFI